MAIPYCRPLSPELANPGNEPVGLVVIAYGIDGYTNHLNGPWREMIEKFAEELEASGFAVSIPDYLTATNLAPGQNLWESIPLYRDKWQDVVSQAIDEAEALPGVDASRIGLLGFSLGGHLCLRLRARAKVVVGYFAPLLPLLGGIDAAGPIEFVQIHHGEADPLPPTNPAVAAQIRQIISKEGTPTELWLYPGAGHGFGSGSDADDEALAVSNTRTVECFAERL